MIFLKHKPIKQLSNLVENIWYCSSDNSKGISLTLPFQNHELIINFSANYQIIKVHNKEFVIDNTKAWINGIQSKAYYSYYNGKQEMIGVLFKPIGLKSFLNYHSCDFANNFIDANLIFGNTINTLIDKVQDTPSVQKKFHLVESFLIEKLINVELPRYLNYSISQIKLNFGIKGFISNLCNFNSVSNKSLIKSFKKHIGINPTKYAHLHVINKAIKLISKEPGQSLTRLAYKLNFYDQAHFSKLFKSVTSLRPSDYSNFVKQERIDSDSPNILFLG